MLNLRLKKSSLLFLILTVLSALFFISNSLASGDASTTQSGFFVSLVANNILHTSDPNILSVLTTIIRKLAHFTEFALFFGFFNSFMISHTKYKNRAYYFLTFFLILLLPLIDETVQYLSPGRTPQVYDIWVDAAGGIFGVVISGVIFMLVCKKLLKDKKI